MKKQELVRWLENETQKKKCYSCEKVRQCVQLDNGIWVCQSGCAKEVNKDGSSCWPA